jgi:PAS domain S-box-containing protein
MKATLTRRAIELGIPIVQDPVRVDSQTTPDSFRARQAAPAVEWIRALTPGLLAGFAAIAIVLIATLVVGLINLRRVYDATEMVAHTYAVKEVLHRLLATSVDAETGERGFIITGTTGYLEPYERAREAIAADIGQARTLMAGNFEQQADLDRLSATANLKLGELGEAIRQRRESGFVAAQSVVATNVGKRRMDEMRAIVARMDAREDALLRARTAEADQNYRVAALTPWGTTALALLLVIALFVGTVRFGAERQRAAQTAERFRVTLASVGDGVIATDDQGRVTQVNPVAEALTGWTEAEAAGKRLEEVFVLINQASRRPAESPIGRVMRENVIVGLANPTVLIARDGREIPVDDSAAPIRTADGRVAGVVMVFRDVTDRRRSEQVRAALLESERQARTEAEEANRTKDEFLAMVSHELRTPLNAILGWADMLRSGTLPVGKRERALEAVYGNATRQTKLIDELLDLSRIMSGKLQLERSASDLPAVVRSALDVVQPAADAKRIPIAVDADPSLGPFYADSGRLQQILVNLISNAIKFTPEEGAIQVCLRRADSAVELVVTDTGQGISPGFISAVFEPFRQADRSTARRHGGLGLGLSIVKHLVEAHGGTIKAESGGDGQGSTFTVRLPIVAVSIEPADTAPANPSATPLAVVRPVMTTLHGISILVVDDDADSRDLLAATLEHHGAVVLTAASVGEALDMLRTSPVQVLLTDIAMPGEDGYSLIRKVRKLGSPGTADLPAVALTSLAREEDRQEALQAGFELHLAKPIDSQSLVEAVASLVNRIEAH